MENTNSFVAAPICACLFLFVEVAACSQMPADDAKKLNSRLLRFPGPKMPVCFLSKQASAVLRVIAIRLIWRSNTACAILGVKTFLFERTGVYRRDQVAHRV